MVYSAPYYFKVSLKSENIVEKYKWYILVCCFKQNRKKNHLICKVNSVLA